MQVSELSSQVKKDPALLSRMSADPVATLETVVATSPLQSDRWIYRTAVLVIGVFIILVAGGAIVGMVWGKTMPTELYVMGGSALGALGLLVKPPERSS